MQIYDDNQNKSGMKIAFMFMQMMVLMVVYIIIYTSFMAVGFAIKEYDANMMMYFPVVIALVVFPVLLYRYRKMFNAGRMLVASIWTMASASLVIVLLYVYIAQITS